MNKPLIILRVLVTLIAIASIGGLTTGYFQARELRDDSIAITATADSLKKIGTALSDFRMSAYDKLTTAERTQLDDATTRLFNQADSLYTYSATEILKK